MPLRLKSLELQGYKTFASRTTFEFGVKKARTSFHCIVHEMLSQSSNRRGKIEVILKEQRRVNDIDNLHGKALFAKEQAQRKFRLAGKVFLFQEATRQSHLAEIHNKMHFLAGTKCAGDIHSGLLLVFFKLGGQG